MSRVEKWGLGAVTSLALVIAAATPQEAEVSYDKDITLRQREVCEDFLTVLTKADAVYQTGPFCAAKTCLAYAGEDKNQVAVTVEESSEGIRVEVGVKKADPDICRENELSVTPKNSFNWK